MNKFIIAVLSGLCLSCSASTISIEVRFVQMDVTNSTLEYLVTNLLASNAGPATRRRASSLHGILTRPQFQTLQRVVNEGTNGANSFVAARVTTASGQQAEVEMTDTATNAEKDILEFNLRLAVTPTIPTNDEYSIEMHFTSDSKTSLPFFQNPPRRSSSGIPVTTLSDVLPPAHTVRDSVDCTAWDGQTLVLEQFPDQLFVDKKRDGQREKLVFSAARKKRLLVFVTPTLIGEQDQRIHPDSTMPMAQNAVPPQTAAGATDF